MASSYDWCILLSLISFRIKFYMNSVYFKKSLCLQHGTWLECINVFTINKQCTLRGKWLLQCTVRIQIYRWFCSCSLALESVVLFCFTWRTREQRERLSQMKSFVCVCLHTVIITNLTYSSFEEQFQRQQDETSDTPMLRGLQWTKWQFTSQHTAAEYLQQRHVVSTAAISEHLQDLWGTNSRSEPVLAPCGSTSKGIKVFNMLN
jgi:hypothetical protein